MGTGNIFAQAAEQKRIQELPESIYEQCHSLEGMCRYQGQTNLGMLFTKASEIEEIDGAFESRKALVGTYAIDHSSVVFCNEKGEVYIAKYTEEYPDVEQALFNAGYSRNSGPSEFYENGINIWRTQGIKVTKFGESDGPDLLDRIYG